jgi:hypothetical protein
MTIGLKLFTLSRITVMNKHSPLSEIVYDIVVGSTQYVNEITGSNVSRTPLPAKQI